MEISKQDFERWKLADAVTREVLDMMKSRNDEICRQLGLGACLGNESLHGVAVGRVEEINYFLNLEYEDLFSEVVINPKKE